MAFNIGFCPLSSFYTRPPRNCIRLLPLQDFQYFVVIDFEATCDKEKVPYPQEIIEFPSVIVSGATGQIKSSFQTYVRPTCNQLLSDFCKDLTGIHQHHVDKAVTLSEALFLHDKWLDDQGVKNTNFTVVTWSNWDCEVMLESECRYKNIQKPAYFNRWINLRIPFRQVFGNVKCNLKEAVELTGLVWQGRLHCGLDDAINIAHLLSVIMRRGFKLYITKSFTANPKTSFTWTHLQFAKPQRKSALQVSRGPQFQNYLQDYRYCFCGARSFKKMVRKPGPKQGNFFFGCGNWTPNRGACCNYFEWSTLKICMTRFIDI